MFSITAASSQHITAIYTLILDLAQHEGILDEIKMTESDLHSRLFCDNPHYFVAVALEDQCVVGLVMYNRTYNNLCFHLEPGLYIEHLYVAPSHRKQGIGRTLFIYVAQEAQTRGYSRIEWWVGESNAAAIDFYLRLGAQTVSGWRIFECNQAALSILTIRYPTGTDFKDR